VGLEQDGGQEQKQEQELEPRADPRAYANAGQPWKLPNPGHSDAVAAAEQCRCPRRPAALGGYVTQWESQGQQHRGLGWSGWSAATARCSIKWVTAKGLSCPNPL